MTAYMFFGFGVGMTVPVALVFTACMITSNYQRQKSPVDVSGLLAISAAAGLMYLASAVAHYIGMP